MTLSEEQGHDDIVEARGGADAEGCGRRAEIRKNREKNHQGTTKTSREAGKTSESRKIVENKEPGWGTYRIEN